MQLFRGTRHQAGVFCDRSARRESEKPGQAYIHDQTAGALKQTKQVSGWVDRLLLGKLPVRIPGCRAYQTGPNCMMPKDFTCPTLMFSGTRFGLHLTAYDLCYFAI